MTSAYGLEVTRHSRGEKGHGAPGTGTPFVNGKGVDAVDMDATVALPFGTEGIGVGHDDGDCADHASAKSTFPSTGRVKRAAFGFSGDSIKGAEPETRRGMSRQSGREDGPASSRALIRHGSASRMPAASQPRQLVAHGLVPNGRFCRFGMPRGRHRERVGAGWGTRMSHGRMTIATPRPMSAGMWVTTTPVTRRPSQRRSRRTAPPGRCPCRRSASRRNGPPPRARRRLSSEAWPRPACEPPGPVRRRHG